MVCEPKQRSGSVNTDRVGRWRHVGSHHPAVVRNVEQLLPVPPPSRMRAASRRNTRLTAAGRRSSSCAKTRRGAGDADAGGAPCPCAPRCSQRRGTLISCSLSVAIMFRPEAIRPCPGPVGLAQGRDIDTGVETGELPGPVRERAQSETCRKIKGATADRPVSVPGVEDHVTVQQARRNASRLVIEDLRADLDRGEVRGRDRAEGTGEARVSRAFLRYVEISASPGGRRYRRPSRAH
jgi:hypothetical protein